LALPEPIKELRQRYWLLDAKDQEQFYRKALKKEQRELLRKYPEFFLFDKQIVEGDQRYTFFRCGRSFGKSVSGAGWLARRIINGATQVGLCGESHEKVINTMLPALRRFFGSWFGEHLNPSLIPYNGGTHTATFGNCTIHCFTAENETRGNNLEYLWCDELGSWCDNIPEKVKNRFDVLNFAVRVGPNPQTLITTTPKPFAMLRQWQKAFEANDPNWKIITGTMDDNPTVSRAFRKAMFEEYAHNKFGRQEFYGDLLDAVEGAMWTDDTLDKCRVDLDSTLSASDHRRLPALPERVYISRIVIAVDPAGSSGTGADETGIMVFALASNGHGYLLEDSSGKYAPLQWAKKVSDLYQLYQANLVVAEKNFGGEMVESTLRTVNHLLPIKLIHASKGKTLRAEPVAALYEKGKIHHVNPPFHFRELESQMLTFNGQPSTKARKDDRLDALTWAATESMLSTVPVYRDFSNLPNFA